MFPIVVNKTNMISLNQICKTYPPRSQVLKEVSITIEEGEFVAVMGKSGSGKSTLMNIIGFLDKPTSGSYAFRTREVNNLSNYELAKLRLREVGFVFQNFNLLPRLTAWQNVALPMAYARVPLRKRKEQALELLHHVGLSDRSTHFPHMLSGGEAQRVAIARALANNPKLIIADEPTGSLDTDTGNEVIKMLCEQHQQGRTIVMVTHDAQVASYARRIVKVQDGQVLN